MVKINKALIESIKPPIPKEFIRDDSLVGFGVRVSPKGRITFIAEGRIRGQLTKRITLGTYPAMSVATAKDLARETIQQFQQGIDPKAEQQTKQANEKAMGITVGQVFENYLDVRKLATKTESDYRNTFRLVFSGWSSRPIRSIVRSEVEKLFSEVAKSRGDRTAEKAFTILSALFNFSSTDEVNGVRILNSNPCDVIKVKKLVRRSNPKERFLLKEEIARLYNFYYVEMDWPETKPHGVTKQGIHYFLLLLHTGLRRSEAFKLRWEDVNWQDKIVTVRATKNGTNHRFPMSTGTLHILKQQRLIADKSEWVFPAKSSMGHMTEPKSQLEKLKQATNLDFCLHDLRRTFATHAQAAGMDFHLIQQALNHKSGGGVTRQYIISQMEILQKVFQAVSDAILDYYDPGREGDGAPR